MRAAWMEEGKKPPFNGCFTFLTVFSLQNGDSRMEVNESRSAVGVVSVYV